MFSARFVDRSVAGHPWWSAGCLPREPGPDKPRWAKWAERAVAAAPVGPDQVAGDHPEAETLLSPFVAEAVRRFRERVLAVAPDGGSKGLVEPAALCRGFCERLGTRLSELSTPTLRHEWQRTRSTEAADREDFADYLRATATADGLETLLCRYPVLARLVGEACQQAVEVTAEILDRFVQDRDAIVSALLDGADPGRLTGIEPAGGDRHQGGRSVVFLNFADRVDQVVYKPRCPESSNLYAALVGRLCQALPELALESVPTLVRLGYGWSRFIAPAPCRTAEEAQRFYYLQGALLALLYASNGTDVHAQNLIACGDQPLLTDTETLLHPPLAQLVLTGGDPALAALNRSVLHVLLLPTLIRGEHGAADISGLGGPAAGANRPTLDGTPLDPADYVRDLRRGFCDGYEAICRNAETFLETLAAAADEPLRILPRATRVYADLLKHSTRPEFLRDARERQRLFETALADTSGFAGADRLLEHEYRELWQGDIPIFFARPGSRSIRAGDGTRVGELLDSSGLAVVRAKLRAMDAADRHNQEWIIDAAFATGAGPIDHRCAAGIAPPDRRAARGSLAGSADRQWDPQWALDTALAVADRLDESAHRGDGRTNWLGLEPLEDGYWAILPTGAGLAHGYTGVALFLAQLGVVADRPRLLDRAADALRPLPLLLDALAERPAHLAAIGCGFAGLGGIAYALARLAVLLDSPDLRKSVPIAIELIGRADAALSTGPRATETFIDGRPEAIAALRAIYRDLGTPEAERLARELEGNDFQRPETESHDASDDAWCTGIAGRAAAGLLAPEALETWLDRLSAAPTVSDLSLCHGELGILEALTVLAPQNERARTVLGRRRALLPAAVACGAWLNGTPGDVPTPGLLHGLAGTGYGLLRMGFADKVPSVLLLEPSTSEETG